MPAVVEDYSPCCLCDYERARAKGSERVSFSHCYLPVAGGVCDKSLGAFNEKKTRKGTFRELASVAERKRYKAAGKTS